MSGDRTELMVRQVRPNSSGHGDGVDRPAVPVFDLVELDQGEKHVDVKAYVVRSDHPLREVRPDLRPQLPKVGSVRHISPGDAMDIGKVESLGRRADQPIPPFDDHAVLHDRQPELAGAVHRRIRSLKIDSSEIRAVVHRKHLSFPAD